MTEPPFVLKPKRHSLLPHSPTRLRERTDDILVHLTPSTAVDALSSTGALWWCLEGVTASERDFAMRTAVASLRIWEWLDELSDWEWPLEGGSSGFENPSGRGISRRLSFQLAKSAFLGGGDFIGSLPASLVTTYERRVDEIARDMEDLELEDIKNSIITHHIIPLSRPSTPVSASGHILAGLEYTKMEDLSAVVTAIVIQTLPNLAKLSQLLRIWSIRLTVLQRVPPLLLAIEDAEVGLKAGWNAVSKPVRQSVQVDSSGAVMQRPKLKRGDFEIMRHILVKKVSAPGRHVDFMLDCLEGMDDVLPESWLDRLEDIERQYAEWVAVCENKVREGEWAKPVRDIEPIQESQVSHVSTAADSLIDTDLSELSNEVEDESVIQEEIPAINRTMSPVDEEEEEGSELPALRSSIRRNSDASGELEDRGDSSRFDLFSSDLPDVSASPPVPRGRIRQAETVDDSPPSSPPAADQEANGASNRLLESPVIISNADESRDEVSFVDDFDDSISVSEVAGPTFRRESSGDMQLRQQISEIIESIPAKIKLSVDSSINLNPPDLQLPRLKKKPSREGPAKRSASGMSSRTVTPSFTLAPARNVRPRSQRGQQEIKVYYLSRSTGEPPIKLFIRCVGEKGERVMVRVGGGWADLGEYLKEYATHHGRRSTAGDKSNKVEVRAVSKTAPADAASSPASRPPSAAATSGANDVPLPVTPLSVRKTRGSVGAASNDSSVRLQPNTPADTSVQLDVAIAPSSGESTRSRPSSRLSWAEDDTSFLGLAGPTGKKVEMSEESKAWVESVKEKVRQASGSEKKPSGTEEGGSFGELGRVGGTTRLFRKPKVR